MPYLAVDDGEAALAHYQEALGATVDSPPMYMPDGGIGHVTLRVGDALFMMSDAFPEMGAPAPTDLGGTTVAIMLYVPDVDAATQRAADAGMTVEMPVTEQFWGNRDSRLVDAFGHRWNLATKVEDVGSEELKARADSFAAQMAAGEDPHG